MVASEEQALYRIQAWTAWNEQSGGRYEARVRQILGSECLSVACGFAIKKARARAWVALRQAREHLGLPATLADARARRALLELGLPGTVHRRWGGRLKRALRQGAPDRGAQAGVGPVASDVAERPGR